MDAHLAVDELRSALAFAALATKARAHAPSAAAAVPREAPRAAAAGVPPAAAREFDALHADARAALKPAGGGGGGGDSAVESDATHKRVMDLLRTHGVAFDTLEHAATRTSEESAAVRGVPLASGAKAMLLKAAKPLAHGGLYLLAVMSAPQQVDWATLRKVVGAPKLSMAPLEDVACITGCLPGAVPPFGSLFAGTKTIVDKSLVAQGPTINFNAGLRTRSVLHLGVPDYLRIEAPDVLSFTTATA